MKWAIQNRERIEASPSARALCPSCGGEVLAKCGEIMVWHWAHLAQDCDPWNEPESEWHVAWKNIFPKNCQEVVVGNHRADIKTYGGLVLELQASPLSPQEIEAREKHYGNMLWILRGADFWENIDLRKRDGYYSFRWKWPRKSWWAARCPIVIDSPIGIFHIRKLHHNTPCGGWGETVNLPSLMSTLMQTKETVNEYDR